MSCYAVTPSFAWESRLAYTDANKSSVNVCKLSWNELNSSMFSFRVWSTSPLTTNLDVSDIYPKLRNWSNVLFFNLFNYALDIILDTYFWCDNFFCSYTIDNSCFLLLISSSLLLSSSSSLWASSNSASLNLSNSDWCFFMAFNSSSSSTSILACSRVLPTITWRIGSTSMSKSNKSPSHICVSISTPFLLGMNLGVGGLSI